MVARYCRGTNKQRNNLLPEIFNDYCKKRNEIHNITVRNSNKLNITKTKTTQGKKMLKIKGALLYNSLPEELLNVETVGNFKTKSKDYIRQIIKY